MAMRFNWLSSVEDFATFLAPEAFFCIKVNFKDLFHALDPLDVAPVKDDAGVNPVVPVVADESSAGAEVTGLTFFARRVSIFFVKTDFGISE
jgi:hypothetical protein